MLGSPHLVLPHPGDHDGLATGDLPDLAHHVLREELLGLPDGGGGVEARVGGPGG